jgi:hypothetical protein
MLQEVNKWLLDGKVKKKLCHHQRKNQCVNPAIGIGLDMAGGSGVCTY